MEIKLKITKKHKCRSFIGDEYSANCVVCGKQKLFKAFFDELKIKKIISLQKEKYGKT
jgi:hypothetical protein